MKDSKFILVTLLLLFLVIDIASGAVRLKDVAQVRDQRETQLIGLGLVVGLEGSGDGRMTQFTIQQIGNMMRKMGVEVPSKGIKVKNVAAVMVTANVSPYVKDGGTFDVMVSSAGDATSIEGGTLLITLLTDINMQQYGKAQGPVSVGGTNKDYGASGGVVNYALNNGAVLNGGILEREIPTLGMDERSMLVTLLSPDFTTSSRLAEAINEMFGTDLAAAQDAGSVIINVPEEYSSRGEIVKFIAEVESVTFVPDNRARVIINERTGTIIAGGNVSLGPVAITHGNLSLSISQPAAAAPQQPAMPGQEPTGDRLVTLGEMANVNEIAQALNLLGVSPRDLIAILQALKRSGSLRAELVIM